MIRVAVAVLAVGLVIAGCFLRGNRRQVTGTCQGACDHYARCRDRDEAAARTRCLRECPEVFSDPVSLGAFENLSCRDAVEYVDGTAPRTSHR